MWLSWDMGALLAVCLAGTGAATKRLTERRWALIADFLVEASLVASLYAVWQLITTVVNTGAKGAIPHGRWVLDVERWMRLPSEASWNHAILGQKLLVEACNGFYAIVHVPALGIFLVWLFLRHRDQYPEIRNALAILTLACFAIHLIPVAPPRLISGTGFVDTALRYHQSVYGPVGTGISDQVSAMPSVHIAWAALIAWGAIKAGTGRWRWLVLLHLVISMVVVVVTANHFWLDGLVAIALLVPSAYLGRAIRLMTLRTPGRSVAASACRRTLEGRSLTP